MYNEAANIEGTLRRLSHLAAELSNDYEIIVSDDASTDKSADIVERLAEQDKRLKLVRLSKNTKFGGALSAGLANTSKEVVVYTDADLPVKEDDVRKGLAMLDDADVITGYSMVIKDTTIKRIVMSKGYNFLVQLLFGLSIKDINSGFKIYKAEAVRGLKLISKSPFVDVEIFAEAERRGFKIKQFGLLFDLRTQGVSTISRLPVVIRTFWDMLKYRFTR